MPFKLISTERNKNIFLEVNEDVFELPFTCKKNLMKELSNYKKTNNLKPFSFCVEFYLQFLPNNFDKNLLMPDKAITKDKLIKKYGREEGVLKWEDYLLKQRFANNPSMYEKKHGREKAKKRLQQRNKKHKLNSISCKEHWLNKGYTEKQAIEKIKKQASKGKTIEWFVNEFGEVDGKSKFLEYKTNHSKKTKENNPGSYLYWVKRGYTEIESKEKVLEHLGKSLCKGGKIASNQSLIFLEPLYKKLIRCCYNEEDIFLGLGDKYEYFIKTEYNFYRYDFCLKSKNIIIEYNGIHVHPSKKFLTDEQWSSWVHPFDGRNATEKREYDEEKIQEAKNRGFSVLEIWSCEDHKIIKNKINKFLKENKVW